MKIKMKLLSIIICSASLMFVAGCQGYSSSSNNDTTSIANEFNNSESDKSQSLLANEQKKQSQSIID